MTAALEYLDSLQGSGIRPGLGRIRAILRHLDDPQKSARSIIVAGTNGKGSTSAMIASILVASGYRTGHYISPHLVDIHERWTIDGAPIDDALLEQSVTELRAAAEAAGIEPTYFEALTIVAFIAFHLAGCEIAVLEVGMGGRLDATNVVRPIAAVITPIGFDHMEYLGTTIRKIAAEKAGVIHRGAIVLTSNEGEAVLTVLRSRAEKFDNRFIVVHDEHDTPLAGDFQRRNAALAARTAAELAPRLERITRESIERGIAQTIWRGRLQHLRVRGKEIWIDGGHNAHAARAIAPYIRDHVPPPRTLVFGIMSDKDVAEVARVLFPLFDRVIATEPFPPRSTPAVDLAALAHAAGLEASAQTNPAAAIEAALASPEPSVVIAGSLYLAGAALAYFRELGVESGERRDDDRQ